MTRELLACIADRMRQIGIPYQYETYHTDGKLPDPYFVGHCSSTPNLNEDGKLSGTFLLTGTSTSWSKLEDAHKQILLAFPRVSGLRGGGDGYLLFINYANAIAVPTDDAKIKRMQINLNYQEWSVE